MDASRHYRIGEIAERTGVSVETLRYYEKRRLLNAPARTQGGYRVDSDATGESGEVQRTQRRRTEGFTVFFTGFSAAGKSTIANVLFDTLQRQDDRPVTILDGDVLRRSVSSDLGYSKEDRDINVRRIGLKALEIMAVGGIALSFKRLYRE